jgi:hypothetical protein
MKKLHKGHSLQTSPTVPEPRDHSPQILQELLTTIEYQSTTKQLNQNSNYLEIISRKGTTTFTPTLSDVVC